jgi:DNA primase
MWTEALLDEIKSRIDIVEIVSEYVSLKKAGQNYKGLCPFHSEKTPSFTVSQPKQIFHCFGCGTGGDVITFLMKHENLEFIEAVRYCAGKAGIQLKEEDTSKGSSSEKRTRMLRMNELAVKFYQKMLAADRTASAYLSGRGILEESVSSFLLGYAPDVRDGLVKELKKAGYSDAMIREAGLANSDTKGARDLFRKRIIFPIANYKNDVIGFGGRVMDNTLPKYLNSPETWLFKKGENLFALGLAKDEIRKKGYALIVEGYLDAIICHQFGFRNAVAPLGTSLTAQQVRRLTPLSRKVVLVFDSDHAGIAAARRSLLILCENDFTSKVLLLPEGEDPDSYLRSHGQNPFQQMIAQSMSTIKFLFTTAPKGTHTEIIKGILGIIAPMKDRILADEHICELADRSRVHESVLRSELDLIRRKGRPRSMETRPPPKKTVRATEEHILLNIVLAYPEKADGVLSNIRIHEIRDETVRSVFTKILEMRDEFSVSRLLEKADAPERGLITDLMLNPTFDMEHIDLNIQDCLQTIKQKRFEEERKTAEEHGDITLLNSLLQEKRKRMKREKS